MSLTCRDLIGIKTFEKIKLAAGEKGLDKLITWPYVKQTECLRGWLNGGEILFVVDENRKRGPEFFTDIIRQAKELDVSSIVFFCGGDNYVEILPEEALTLSNLYKIPLFEMPSEMRMIDVMKDITNAIFLWNYKNRQAANFLSEMIHEDFFSTMPESAGGSFYGFDLSKSYFLTIVSDKKTVFSMNEMASLSLSNRFSVAAMKIQQLCDKYGDKLIYTEICGMIICYISVDNNQIRKEYIAGINKLLKSFNSLNACDMKGGASKLYSRLEDMPKAYYESRQTLRFSMKHSAEKNIFPYEDMGILQFLISERDKTALLDYCNDMLAELYEWDEKGHTEYVKTLGVYLKNNNNMVQTSKVLYIHRNTLVNRINKIQAIIGKDINCVEVKMEYLNIFSILEFYGQIEL